MCDIKLPELERVCPECNGAGAVAHPAWVEWDARNRGRHWREREPLPDEPEEIDCPACRGTGKVLTPEGQRLLDFIRRHL